MIKKPLFITVSICAVGLVVFIAVQQIANVRRGNAIEAYLLTMKAIMIEGGLSDESIIYDKSCSRDNNVFGGGPKRCGRSIEAEKSDVNFDYAKNMFRKFDNDTKLYPGADIQHTEADDFLEVTDELKEASGYILIDIENKTNCSIFVRYDVRVRPDIRPEDKSPGNAHISISCNDTSWWVRQGLF